MAANSFDVIERWRQHASAEDRYAEKIPELWNKLVQERRSRMDDCDPAYVYYLGLVDAYALITGHDRDDVDRAVTDLARTANIAALAQKPGAVLPS